MGETKHYKYVICRWSPEKTRVSSSWHIHPASKHELLGPTMGLIGLMDMGLPFRNQRGPKWANHWEFSGEPLLNLYGANHGHYMGQDNGHPLIKSMIRLHVCEKNGFTWAVSWADQCEPHVIPMCDKTVALRGQLHGPSNVNSMQCQCVEKQWLYRGSFMGRLV